VLQHLIDSGHLTQQPEIIVGPLMLFDFGFVLRNDEVFLQ
jgi:hypothetical protein